MMHKLIPVSVGIKADKTVHFKLPVSFLIVMSVVEHGKCISEKSIVHIAVVAVHPFDINISFKSERLGISVIAPCDIYAISAIGLTISFAGKPNMNAINMIPSSPINCANGSKKLAT